MKDGEGERASTRVGRDTIPFDELEEEGRAHQRTQRALGYDWGGFDLASPWDTGHEIVALGHTPPARATPSKREREPALSPDALATPERIGRYGRSRVEHHARKVLASAGFDPSGQPRDVTALEAELDGRLRQRARMVINATGSVLDPVLGRAPWSAKAKAAAERAAGYTDVDFDVEAARWGARGAAVEERLCALTGAEAALVVSGQAAGVLLALTALVDGGTVVVCRGDLVELDDGRRISDVLDAARVQVQAVGAVNHTTLQDVLTAVDRVLAGRQPVEAILAVQHGLGGPDDRPALTELARQGVPLVVDHAQGVLHGSTAGGEAVVDAVAAGAEVICFAGDGPLGGPQAGLIVGQAVWIERMRRHPLYRMLQLDKTLLAALEATLDERLRGIPVPVDRMRACALDTLRTAVEHWQAVLHTRLDCRVVDVEPGDGRSPDDLPSVALAIHGPRPQAIAVALARGEPAVVGRFGDGALLLDARTVLPLDLGGQLLTAVERAADEVLGRS